MAKHTTPRAGARRLRHLAELSHPGMSVPQRRAPGARDASHGRVGDSRYQSPSCRIVSTSQRSAGGRSSGPRDVVVRGGRSGTAAAQTAPPRPVVTPLLVESNRQIDALWAFGMAKRASGLEPLGAATGGAPPPGIAGGSVIGGGGGGGGGGAAAAAAAAARCRSSRPDSGRSPPGTAGGSSG